MAKKMTSNVNNMIMISMLLPMINHPCVTYGRNNDDNQFIVMIELNISNKMYHDTLRDPDMHGFIVKHCTTKKGVDVHTMTGTINLPFMELNNAHKLVYGLLHKMQCVIKLHKIKVLQEEVNTLSWTMLV